MTVYIDGVASTFGASVNRYSSGNVTGFNVRRDRVIVQHADAGPITNANVGNWDNANDADINFDEAAGALTLEAGAKLIVNTGDTFTPGGTVTLTTGTSPSGDLLIQSTATLDMGTNALSIGGDLVNSGTLTLAGGQTTRDY